MKYLEDLIADASIALKALPINERVITDMGDINSLIVTKGVYIIEEIKGDSVKTYQNFLDYKSKHLVAMPKSNTSSDVLYVGSSRNNLKQRLLQHAGYGHGKTYALHLKDWFKGQVKITIKEYDVSDSVLQLIEDAIAFDLKPAFGKRGSNSK
jgi:hypothetical protein